MTYNFITIRTLAAVSAVVIASAGAHAQVQRQATPVANLKAPTTRQQVTPVPCNSVSACNQIIAYCAASNGTWIESSHNGTGQPNKGICYVD